MRSHIFRSANDSKMRAVKFTKFAYDLPPHMGTAIWGEFFANVGDGGSNRRSGERGMRRYGRHLKPPSFILASPSRWYFAPPPLPLSPAFHLPLNMGMHMRKIIIFWGTFNSANRVAFSSPSPFKPFHFFSTKFT